MIAYYYRSANFDQDKQSRAVMGFVQHAAQNNIKSYCVLIDDACSGMDENRAGYEALVNRMIDGTITGVYTPTIEHISRDTTTAMRFLDLAKKKNVSVNFMEQDANE